MVSESSSPLRIVLAVAVGYGVASALVIAGSSLLLTTLGAPAGPPTTGFLIGNIAIRIVGTVCAGYACARVAPDDRRLISMALLILFFLAGAAAAFRTAPDTNQPQGYVALVSLLGVIGVWAGAMIERAMHGKPSPWA